MSGESISRTGLTVLELEAMLFRALDINHKLEKIMATTAELVTKVTAMSGQVGQIKTGVDALVASGGQPAPELVAAIDKLATDIDGAVAALPTGATPPPPAGGGLPGS